jgi:hypothetical protein
MSDTDIRNFLRKSSAPQPRSFWDMIEGLTCPDCGHAHSGSPMQFPSGYSGCPTCGYCQ